MKLNGLTISRDFLSPPKCFPFPASPFPYHCLLGFFKPFSYYEIFILMVPLMTLHCVNPTG